MAENQPRSKSESETATNRLPRLSSFFFEFILWVASVLACDLKVQTNKSCPAQNSLGQSVTGHHSHWDANWKKQRTMGSRVQISAPILQAICGLVSSGETSVLGGLMRLDDCQPNWRIPAIVSRRNPTWNKQDRKWQKAPSLIVSVVVF